MRPNDPYDAGTRRRLRPGIEGLEARDLPSAAPLATAPAAPPSQAATTTIHALGDPTGLKFTNKSINEPYNTVPRGLIGKGKLQPFLNPTVIQEAATALYGPPPTAQNPNPNYPTPAELQREEFTASAVGRYTVGVPSFSDRSERIYAFGKAAASDAFLKAKWQVVLQPPADPDATPNPGDPYANQVTGVAVFISQNYLQTGSGLMLDLDANVAPGSDPNALPTHGTWTLDTNSSGGFTAPFGFTQGAGTWTAKYLPDAHPVAGANGSGTVVFEFQGLYNFSQLLSAISKFYS